MILEEKKFGRWTVIEPGKTKNGKPGYKCQCDCGKIKVVASCHLKNGGSRSCGCLKSELSREYKNPRTLQLDGQKFGRWLVLNTEKGKNNKSVCVCLCDCGNLKKVSGHELKRGKSKSCGCLTRELASLRSRKHGMCYTHSYKAWSRMMRRCYSPKSDKWKDYGARGIKVCQKWHSFENFYTDMGNPPKGKSLDRIDNDGDYCPENCRWADAKVQTRNRRISINITFEGQNKSLQEWADEKGLRYDTLWKRLKIRGWSIEKALTVKEGRGRRGQRTQS